MTITPYLDQIGFTRHLASKFKALELIKVDDLVCKIDNLMERSGVHSNPVDQLVNHWVELCDGVIYGYADIFNSYQLLFNLLECVRKQEHPTQTLICIHLMLQELYAMLPAPTVAEVKLCLNLKKCGFSGHIFIINVK